MADSSTARTGTVGAETGSAETVGAGVGRADPRAQSDATTASGVEVHEGQHSATGEDAVAHHQHHDPMAEPSAEWGWHGGFPRAARIGGWAIAAILLLMMIGNHEGRVEDLWLIGLAFLTVVVLVWDMARRRTSWRK